MHSTPQLGAMGSGVGGGMYHHSIPHHLQVQSLHYPSSTPVQFAPGLQRITSPLLLSTTSSIRQNPNTTTAPNTKPLSAAQAAGALENMSHELGPSATFKLAGGTSLLGGGRKDVSLMTPNSSSSSSSEPKIKQEFSTPSSALMASAPSAPKIGVSSPSFGPQFSLQQQQLDSRLNHGTPEIRPTSLPPIVSHISPINGTQLPHIQNLTKPEAKEAEEGSTEGSKSNGTASQIPNTNSGNAPTTNSSTGSGSGSGSGAGAGSDSSTSGSSGSGSGGGGGDDNKHNSSPNNSQHEITILKTRISELELVNDLYRTRIMELEAMEQAARLREISMRKRLDEVIYLQEGQAAQAQAQAQSQKQSPVQPSAPKGDQQSPEAPGFQRSPSNSQPFQGYSLPPIYQAVSSVKREFEGSENASKKPKLD